MWLVTNRIQQLFILPNHCSRQSDVMSLHGHRESQLAMLWYFTHVLYFSQQLELDRGEVIRWNRHNGQLFQDL